MAQPSGTSCRLTAPLFYPPHGNFKKKECLLIRELARCTIAIVDGIIY
jgi:hypothetical protein